MEAQWRGGNTLQEVMMGRDGQYRPSEGLHGFIRLSLGFFPPPTSERKSLRGQVGMSITEPIPALHGRWGN